MHHEGFLRIDLVGAAFVASTYAHTHKDGMLFCSFSLGTECSRSTAVAVGTPRWDRPVKLTVDQDEDAEILVKLHVALGGRQHEDASPVAYVRMPLSTACSADGSDAWWPLTSMEAGGSQRLWRNPPSMSLLPD